MGHGEVSSAFDSVDAVPETMDETIAGRRPIVVVLGMHRSGTSLCASLLSALGVDMADDIGRGVGNGDGHWERWELVSQHDRLLTALDRAYGGVGDYFPQHDLRLPKGWLADPATRAVGRDIEAFLRHRMPPGELFGFKDPRTCRFLPLWLQIFERLSLEPIFIICVRNPVAVALSLAKRDGIPEIAGHYRWFLYNADCFRHVRSNYIVVDYASWFSDPKATVDRVAKFVLPRWTPPITSSVLDVIDSRLDHGGTDRSSDETVSRFFDRIKQLETDPSSRVQVDAMVEQFDQFRDIMPFGDVLLDLQARERAAKSELAKGLLAKNEPDELHAEVGVQADQTELANERDADPAAERRDDLVRQAAAASARLHESNDRVQRLEAALATREKMPREITQQIEALTRKAAKLEAEVRSKEFQISKLPRKPA